MTQSYNLSQLANNLTSAGLLDAADGLVNAVPIANGGTGASSASAARTNLVVPSTTGTGASGTWGINITGTATALTTVLAVINGGTGVTTSTGTGAVVLGTSPTLITPALGTPTALVATNATGTANSLNAGVGVNQTWQSLTGSRAYNTTYYNTTGKPIHVSVNINSGGNLFSYVDLYVDGLQIVRNGDLNGNQGANFGWGYVLVPNGSSYYATTQYYGIYGWFELR